MRGFLTFALYYGFQYSIAVSKSPDAFTVVPDTSLHILFSGGYDGSRARYLSSRSTYRQS